MKSTAVLRHSSSFKVAKSIQAEHRDSKLVWDHDRGAEADAKGINTASIHHFCAYALVDATRQWACKHARCTRFGQQSRLLLLDQFDFVSRKPIFRGALKSFFSMEDLSEQ